MLFLNIVTVLTKLQNFIFFIKLRPRFESEKAKTHQRIEKTSNVNKISYEHKTRLLFVPLGRKIYILRPKSVQN